MDTATVAKRLVELCRQQKNMQAVQELYADDIVSVEASGSAEMPAVQKGKQAVVDKHHWWESAVQWHGGSVTGPFMNGDDRFAVIFDMDITLRDTGKRSQMKEVAVYTVTGGKISHEAFFYNPD